MPQMTWNQFKEHVDTLLKEKGISPDEEIWYIDTHYPSAEQIGAEDGGIDCPTVGLGGFGVEIS